MWLTAASPHYMRRVIWKRNNSVHGCDVDNATWPRSADHFTCCMLRPVKRAPQLDVPDERGVMGLEFKEGLAPVRGGVVDENFQPGAELVKPRQDLARPFAVRDIRLKSVGRCSGRLNVSSASPAFFTSTPIHDRDAREPSGEFESERTPEFRERLQ
jgi:hypothetical protein